jgi:hypothetical protein
MNPSTSIIGQYQNVKAYSNRQQPERKSCKISEMVFQKASWLAEGTYIWLGAQSHYGRRDVAPLRFISGFNPIVELSLTYHNNVKAPMVNARPCLEMFRAGRTYPSKFQFKRKRLCLHYFIQRMQYRSC